jgi:hypothetical protein
MVNQEIASMSSIMTRAIAGHCLLWVAWWSLVMGPLTAGEPQATASGTSGQSSVAGPLDGNRFSTKAESLWIGNNKYGSFWQVEFTEPRPIGSILQINSDDEHLLKNAPRNYAWQVSDDGSTWITLPETIIRKETRLFRIHRLTRPVTTKYIRLMVHLAYGSAPALREVEFYPAVDATIPFDDWIVAVSSIEDPDNTTVAMPFVQLARQCAGWEHLPAQHLWHGDFDLDFVSAEPRPLCAFFSGSFLEWCQRSREPWRGVQAVLKSRRLPMWGACGGAQVFAILEEVGVDRPWDCPRCRKPGAPLAPIYSHIGHTGDTFCGDYSKSIGERGKYKLKIERSDPAFDGVPEIFEIHESHIGQIDYVPKGWHRLVTNGPGSLTVNQCLRAGDFPIYSAQFHMETYQETLETSKQIMGNFLRVARAWRTAP